METGLRSLRRDRVGASEKLPQMSAQWLSRTPSSHTAPTYLPEELGESSALNLSSILPIAA